MAELIQDHIERLKWFVFKVAVITILIGHNQLEYIPLYVPWYEVQILKYGSLREDDIINERGKVTKINFWTMMAFGEIFSPGSF